MDPFCFSVGSKERKPDFRWETDRGHSFWVWSLSDALGSQILGHVPPLATEPCRIGSVTPRFQLTLAEAG